MSAVLSPLALIGSRPVENLGEKLAWLAAMAAVVVAIYLLMWRGWRSRGRRQGDVPPPPSLPEDAPAPGAVLAGPAEVVYVSTTTAGDWLDRIVAHGLGTRSAAEVVVEPGGVRIEREGAPSFFVPAAALRDVRLERGMAGKFVEEGGLVVLTWELRAGEDDRRLVDTGLRVRYETDKEQLVSALQVLAERRVGP